MVKQTRVAILDNGTMFAKEYQVYWNLPSEAPISMPSFAVLIDHADGLFLFDTGFDLDHFKTAISPAGASQSPAQTLPAQLQLLGLKPTEINYVINSHLHFDHCGGNKYCKHARSICHKCELERAFKCLPFEQLTYSERSFLPDYFQDGDDIKTAGIETISGDQDIAKGIKLFETPGHSAGHYSMLVHTPGRRPMLFTADACYTRRSWDTMHVGASHLDPEKCYNSLLRLKEIAIQHDAEPFFPHDEHAYRTYLKAPAWYE